MVWYGVKNNSTKRVEGGGWQRGGKLRTRKSLLCAMVGVIWAPTVAIAGQMGVDLTRHKKMVASSGCMAECGSQMRSTFTDDLYVRWWNVSENAR